MSENYEILIVSDGGSTVEDEFRAAVAKSLESILDTSELVRIHSDIESVSPDSSVLVVYLQGESATGPGGVTGILTKAIESQIPVLPITLGPPGRLPDVIAHINALDWKADRTTVLSAVLRMLGLAEVDRKVFLSYVRKDSSSIAIQLHTALVQRQYHVFLDCFSVPPGIEFQKRLDQDLGDKAFVVLLESANVRESPWVEYEVSYALGHAISILAVTLPGLANRHLVPAIDDSFRVRLDAGDLDGNLSELNEGGLRKILDRIEWAHARALRRRRKELIGSLRKSLELTGHDLAPVEEWTVLAEKNGDRRIYSVTPRRPRPNDLFDLDGVKGRVASQMPCGPLGASLVHDAALSAGHHHLLQWISFPWNLQVRAVHELSLKGGS